MPILSQNYRWTTKHVVTSLANVLAKPGVYAIGHIKMAYGFEIMREYLYIGCTDNMRRRMREHLPDREVNAKLKKYLRSECEQAKIWYVAGMESGDAKQLEKQLIDEFQPKFNTVGKR